MESEQRNTINEPQISYNQHLTSAIRRHIHKRLDTVQDMALLSRISNMMDEQADSFELRYQNARDFVYANFPNDIAKKLESEDFMIDQAFPASESEVDVERLFQEAEDSGILSEEEAQKIFHTWRS